MAKGKRYDWKAIKADWITGSHETLEELAEKWYLSYGAVRNRASKEKWDEEKDAYLANLSRQVAAETRDRIRRDVGTKEVDVRVRHMQITDSMLAAGIKALNHLLKGDNWKKLEKNPHALLKWLTEAMKLQQALLDIGNETIMRIDVTKLTEKELKEIARGDG